MNSKDYIKKVGSVLYENGYEETLGKMGVSPCRCGYALEVFNSCARKVWYDGIGAEKFSREMEVKLVEKDYLGRMRELEVGKQTAEKIMQMILNQAASLL